MTAATREIAMFPLGSVLFPGMPLPLRVFEPRYVAMLAAVLEQSEPEFGVVLIERGSEVGGGDVRFTVGTVARIVTVDQTDDAIVLLATGAGRFEVARWLDDAPFPRAEVRDLAPLDLVGSTPAELDAAEATVRATIARVSEFLELPWPADVELSADPTERTWQVAGIAPLNSLDQYGLLRSTSASELLSRVVDDLEAAEPLLVAGWGSDPDDDFE